MEQSKNAEEVENEGTMESGKVMFGAPVNSYDQKRKSSIAFRETCDDYHVKSRGTSETPQNIAEDRNETGRSNSWKNSRRSENRASRVGQYDADTVREIDTRRKTMFASKGDLSQISSVYVKIDDSVGAESGEKRKWSDTPTSTEVSGKSSRFRLSDNIPVRSMNFDLPSTAELSPAEADAYADVLERTLDLLELIRYRIPAEVDDRWDETFKTLEEKYDVPAEPKYSLRQYLGLPPLIPSVAEKLQRDRTYIYNVLKELVIDLRKRRRYDRLEHEIDKLAKTLEDEHSLEVNYEIWSEQLEQLRDLIKSEKIDSKIEVKKWISGVRESAADIDDAIFLCNSKLDYVGRWEEARLEGQRLQLEMKEQALQNQLAEYEKAERIDEIIAEEMRAFLRYDIGRMEEEVGILMARFNDEIEERQQDIEHLHEDTEEMEKVVEEKLRLLGERQAFVDECVARRKVEAEEREYWAAVHGAATTIQALWRGHMVRRQLGPYRGLWTSLKKRKKLAAKRRKKLEERRRKLEEKKAAEAKTKSKK